MSVLPVAPVPSSIAEGRYDVHEVIGRGSTARIHRGHDLLLHRDVAVKLVPVADADAAERWWAREVGLRARLEPGQVPGLFDCGRADDDTAFVVLQLALGGTLTDRLRPGPLGLDDTVGLTCTLAESLGRMHARGVRHGDVSVDAVLSDGRGAPLWCGFAPTPSPGPVSDDAEGLARLALSCLSGTGSAEGVDALRGVLDDVVHRGACAAERADQLRDVLLSATRGSGASRRRPSPFPAGTSRHGGERVRSGTGHRRGALAVAGLATVAAVGLGVVGLAESASSQPLEVAAATLAPAPSVPAAGAAPDQDVTTPTSAALRLVRPAHASITRVSARAGSGHGGGSDSSAEDRSSDGASSRRTRSTDARTTPDQDASPEGSSARDSSGQASPGGESSGQDSSAQDSSAQDPSAQDSSGQDSSSRPDGDEGAHSPGTDAADTVDTGGVATGTGTGSGSDRTGGTDAVEDTTAVEDTGTAAGQDTHEDDGGGSSAGRSSRGSGHHGHDALAGARAAATHVLAGHTV